MEYIDSVDKLDELLGEEFIIFCGSALSAKITINNGLNNLSPMVGAIKDEILNLVKLEINNEDKLDTVYLSYIEALLSNNNNFRYFLGDYKFEDFMARISNAFNSKSLFNNYMKCLFYYEKGIFNLNHFSISNLFRDFRLKLCITTNFDNGIENALNQTGFFGKFNKISFSHRKKLPKRISNYFKPPTILKLHGDVETEEYVVTISDMEEAEQLEQFKILTEIMHRKIILFVGYSGNGDVDISPYTKNLKSEDSKIIWMLKESKNVIEKKEAIENIQEFATHYFYSDLYSENPIENWLLKISNVGKQKPNCSNVKFETWVEKLNHFFLNNIDKNISMKIIDEIFEIKRGWPLHHIFLVKKWESVLEHKNDFDKNLHEAIMFLNVGKYRKSLKIMEMMKVTNSLKANTKYQYLRWKGYLYWILADFDKSINTLSPILELKRMQGKNRRILEEGVNIYLRASFDIIDSYYSINKKRDLYSKYKIKKVEEIIKSIRFQNMAIENQFEMIKLDYIVGKKWNFQELFDLFQKSYNLTRWLSVTSLMALFISRINHKEGQQLVNRIRKDYSQYGKPVNRWLFIHICLNTAITIIPNRLSFIRKWILWVYGRFRQIPHYFDYIINLYKIKKAYRNNSNQVVD